MVKDNSDSKYGNPLPPHKLLFPINRKDYYLTDRIKHTTAFVTQVVEHWLEREIGKWVHPMKDRSDDPSHHERCIGYKHTAKARLTTVLRDSYAI